MVEREAVTIAVAMASFQGARFIAEQLESILSQTVAPRDVVISDDGSSDDTVAIAKSFLPHAKKRGITMKVVSRRGVAGVAANFQHAVRATSAELIALADQDDVWMETKLEVLSAHFERQPGLLMVHSDAELVDESGVPLGMRVLDSLRITRSERAQLLSGHAIRALVRRNLVTGSTAMVTRRLVERAGEVPDGWLHDEWWALVAASHGALALEPGVLQHYRQHSDNQVGATLSGWRRLQERFSEPQSAFRERHRVRHVGLQTFVDRASWSGSNEARALLRGRLRHYAWQATLPSARSARVMPIIGELIRGGYHRYRRGVFDALRDAVQPPG